MNVIQLPKINNPNEFYELSSRKQDILVNWIEMVLKPYEIKSYNDFNNSHSLKSVFQYDDGFYLTNGEMKGAMIEAGFQPKNHDHINWTFKLAKSHLKISHRSNLVDLS